MVAQGLEDKRNNGSDEKDAGEHGRNLDDQLKDGQGRGVSVLHNEDGLDRQVNTSQVNFELRGALRPP